MVASPIGIIGVNICLDFLQDDMRESMCMLGCRWFLIPAWTDGLGGRFLDNLKQCGDLAGAVGVIANNRYSLSSAEIVNDPNRVHWFYVPAKGYKGTSGKPLSIQNDNCIWLATLEFE
jgi:hypothetical protein